MPKADEVADVEQLIERCQHVIQMDLGRIVETMDEDAGPLPPERASTVARYMSALALVAKRTRREDGESLEDLLDQCAAIPEVAEAVAAMRRGAS